MSILYCSADIKIISPLLKSESRCFHYSCVAFRQTLPPLWVLLLLICKMGLAGKILRSFSRITLWFYDSSRRQEGSLKSLLWLPQEISLQECLFLLVDILLSYIYNLIEKKCVPRYMFILRSSPGSFPNLFLTRPFCLTLKAAFVWIVCSHGSLKSQGVISAVYLSLTICFSFSTNWDS